MSETEQYVFRLGGHFHSSLVSSIEISFRIYLFLLKICIMIFCCITVNDFLVIFHLMIIMELPWLLYFPFFDTYMNDNLIYDGVTGYCMT